MIDWNNSKDIIELSEKVIEKAKECGRSRELAAKAKFNLDIILASKMEGLRKKKSNLGYETAQVMMLEDGTEEVKTYYKDYLYHSSRYKSLDRVISAMEGQISLIQSIIKNQIKQIHGG